MKESFDAIVIGGGPAGSMAALRLAMAGWSVAVFERQSFPRRKVCGEYVSATNLPLFDAVGLGGRFRAAAGPAVKRVGLLAGGTALDADLPLPPGCNSDWGRALRREHLDAMLLQRACEAGATVFQPWSVVGLDGRPGGHECRVHSRDLERTACFHSPVIIAAHGAWECGPLPTQRARPSSRRQDLFGFKAHFRGARLPEGLMPLLSFVDGYGGMVHCDGGCISLSCCLRRDRLHRLPRDPGDCAGDAVLKHILATCRAARPILEGAELESSWLSAGPIQPGIRPRYDRGIYRVGNAAGEAHPVVAEGISMALQSAWLVADRLIGRGPTSSPQLLSAIGEDYAAAWLRSFSGRIRVAEWIARWASSPRAVAVVLPFVRLLPSLLTAFACSSGKAALLRP